MSVNSSIEHSERTVHDPFRSLDRDRVRRLTFRRDLERIDSRTRDSIQRHADQGKDAITLRLAELDREWPVDRALMAGAGSFVWLGLILGTTAKRRLYGISAAAGAVLLAYAFFGWAPPVLILRRLGFRTRNEINLERIALKVLRGDFDAIREEVPDRETKIDRAMHAGA
ncbi:MAG TPA: DUF2892 domain-containing protein [Fibrobacteria bacterium]|nr:DUF2892 domain-containing protein [Fibrobacteria bacterium]